MNFRETSSSDEPLAPHAPPYLPGNFSEQRFPQLMTKAPHPLPSPAGPTSPALSQPSRSAATVATATMFQRFTSILFGDTEEDAHGGMAQPGCDDKEEDDEWILVNCLGESTSASPPPHTLTEKNDATHIECCINPKKSPGFEHYSSSTSRHNCRPQEALSSVICFCVLPLL